jgi:hypothetical protein
METICLRENIFGAKSKCFAFVQIISEPNQNLLLCPISFWFKQKRSTLP